MKYMFSNQKLKTLIVPLIMEQFLSVMVGIVDVAMVAQAGEAAVSGVSLVNSLNVLLVLVFNSVATGGAVVTARYLGAKDDQRACESTDQLMLAVLLASGAVTAVSLLFNRGILRTIYGSVSMDVMDSASVYFYLTAASYPFLAVYSGAAAVCRSMGDSKSSMQVSTVMNVLNVIGNGILVYVYQMGAAGVGIATLISRIVAAVMMMWLLVDPERRLHVTVGALPKINVPMIREILCIGIPTGVENGMFQAGKLVLASLISTFGTASIAANGVVSTLSLFQVIPGSAIGLAMITVIGQTIGAGEFEQARYYEKKLIRLVILLHLILNSIFIFFADDVVGIYHLSEEAYQMAYDIVVLHGICCIMIWPFSFTLPNAVRAAGDVKFTMRTSITTMILVRIGFGIVLSVWFKLGLRGIWYAMIIDWCVRGICFQRRVSSGRWLKACKAR